MALFWCSEYEIDESITPNFINFAVRDVSDWMQLPEIDPLNDIDIWQVTLVKLHWHLEKNIFNGKKLLDDSEQI